MAKTIAQQTNGDGYPKAGELIEMLGLEALDASQLSISNLLYQHAHDSGQMSVPGAVFEIPVAAIRKGFSTHESGDRLKAHLVALARVVATAGYTDAAAGQNRIVIGALFEFFDIAKSDLSSRSVLRFGLNRRLAEIIDKSGRWGRIRDEVYCAMRSKYAISLYEALALRRNMDRCLETFPIGRFREMLSVKDDTYKIGTDFVRFVVDPAVLEVNGLSDMGVRADVMRKHARAPIHSVAVAWWKKDPQEIAHAVRERNRSKIGRTTRLKGTAETAAKLLDLR